MSQPSGPGPVVPDDGANDAALVREVIEGHVDAFEILVRRHQRPVYSAVLRMVRDPEDARDLAQTAFLKAFEQIGTFDPRYRFFSWIYRIAIHEAINHLQRRKRPEPLVEDVVDDDKGPESRMEGRELERAVQAALAALTPEHRAVVILRHFLDGSYQEIAVALEIPEKTVKSRLFEARRALRLRLETMGILK
ncbi:MAG TPA: sigma-70 family RNA polymerase sigma factor [Candidatus Polarisedimenticolaceae bacterium]